MRHIHYSMLLAFLWLTGRTSVGDEPKPILIRQGFSSEESLEDSTWRWLSDDNTHSESPLVGIIGLPNTGKEMTFKIAGEVPLHVMPRTPTMKLLLNGEPLDEFRPPAGRFEKAYTVTAARQGKGDYSELRVVIDTFTIPNQRNKKSSDARRLGFKLHKLHWHDAQLKEFDAAEMVRFGDGFFSLEKLKDVSWRWLGDGNGQLATPLEGVVNLRTTGQDMNLTIAGAVPMLSNAPTMKLILNGEQLDEFGPPKGRFEKTYRVAAARQGKAEYCELRVVIDKYFIPKEVEKNATDPRRLGFKLYQLTWQGDAPLGDVGGAATPPIQVAETPPIREAEAEPMGRWRLWLLITLPIFLVAVLLSMRHYRRFPKTAAAEKQAESEATPQWVSFRCSGCGKELKAKGRLVGKKVKCSQCGQAVLVS